MNCTRWCECCRRELTGYYPEPQTEDPQHGVLNDMTDWEPYCQPCYAECALAFRERALEIQRQKHTPGVEHAH